MSPLLADLLLQLIHSVALLVVEQAAPKNVYAKSLFTAGMFNLEALWDQTS